jgi:predicted Zn-dependent protease with MMP-like domain
VTAADEAPAAGHPTHADFERWVNDALDQIPAELWNEISNVEIVVEDGPPPPENDNLLGLYQGVPLTRRTRAYANFPDKITLYRTQFERYYGRDREVLEREVRRIVWHELAHHFGISDERLVEIDRY